MSVSDVPWLDALHSSLCFVPRTQEPKYEDLQTLALLLTQKEKVRGLPEGHRKSKNKLDLSFLASTTYFSYITLSFTILAGANAWGKLLVFDK